MFCGPKSDKNGFDSFSNFSSGDTFENEKVDFGEILADTYKAICNNSNDASGLKKLCLRSIFLVCILKQQSDEEDKKIERQSRRNTKRQKAAASGEGHTWTSAKLNGKVSLKQKVELRISFSKQVADIFREIFLDAKEKLSADNGFGISAELVNKYLSERLYSEDAIKLLSCYFRNWTKLPELFDGVSFSLDKVKQLFSQYAMEICTSYFNSLDLEDFLSESDDFTACLDLFEMAIGALFDKDAKNKDSLRKEIRKKIEKMNIKLRNDIDEFVLTICSGVFKELNECVIKLQSTEPITWQHDVQESVKDAIYKTLEKQLGAELIKKYFSDLAEQYQYIIRGLMNVAGIPDPVEMELFNASHVGMASQELDRLLVEFGVTIKKPSSSFAPENRLLSAEQKKKMREKIMEYFFRSGDNQKEKIPQPNRSSRRSIASALSKTKNRRTLVTTHKLKQPIDLVSYLSRLKLVNPFGVLLYFLSANSLEFDNSFNLMMFGDANGKKTAFLGIPTEKYTLEEGKKVLSARFKEESLLHSYVARFGNNLYNVGLKHQAVLYMIMSYAFFYTCCHGIGLKNLSQQTHSLDKKDFVDFKLWNGDEFFAHNKVSACNQGLIRNYIDELLQNLKKRSTERDSRYKLELIEEALIRVYATTCKLPDAPLLEFCIQMRIGSEDFFTKVNPEELVVMMLFMVEADKIVEDTNLNKIKEKDDRYYELLWKYVKQNIVSTKGGSVYDKLIGILNSKDYTNTVKAWRELECANCSKDHKNVLVNSFSKIVYSVKMDVMQKKIEMKKSRNKVMDISFAHQLIMGLCDFIQHGNNIGVELSPEARMIVHNVYAENTKIHKDAYAKNLKNLSYGNKVAYIEDLQKRPENSMQFGKGSDDYLTNLQKISFGRKNNFLQFVSNYMQQVFFDYVMFYHRKTVLQLALKIFRSRKEISTFKENLSPLISRKLMSLDVLMRGACASIPERIRNRSEIIVDEFVNPLILLVSEYGQENSEFDKLQNFLDCFEKSFSFWEAVYELVQRSIKCQNRDVSVEDRVFFLSVFLQNKWLNGFRGGKNWVKGKLFKMVFNHLCDLIAEDLRTGKIGKNRHIHVEKLGEAIRSDFSMENKLSDCRVMVKNNDNDMVAEQQSYKNYLHFLLTDKLVNDQGFDLSKKADFVACLNYYQKIAHACEGKMVLLAYQEFFKLFLCSLKDKQGSDFRLRLCEVFDLLAGKVRLPRIAEIPAHEDFLVRALGVMRAALSICENHEDPCYNIMYHEINEFVEDKKNPKENDKMVEIAKLVPLRKSSRVSAMVEIAKLVPSRRKSLVSAYEILLQLKNKASLSQKTLHRFYDETNEYFINMYFLDDALVKQLWSHIDFGCELDASGYILSFLDNYYAHLLDRSRGEVKCKFADRKDERSKIAWCQLKLYMESIKSITKDSYLRSSFFAGKNKSITSEQIRLHAQIRFKFYAWYDDGIYGGFRGNNAKKLLKKINELLPMYANRLRNECDRRNSNFTDKQLQKTMLDCVKSVLKSFVYNNPNDMAVRGILKKIFGIDLTVYQAVDAESQDLSDLPVELKYKWI